MAIAACRAGARGFLDLEYEVECPAVSKALEQLERFAADGYGVKLGPDGGALLPALLAEEKGPVAFVHIDCDIYESTRVVFELLSPRIAPGAVIVFDEYFNYPGWQQHEFRAFQDFIARERRRYEYIGFSAERGHVAVRMLAARGPTPP